MENKGDYFSLKWSNFRSSFSKGFHDFLQEESMVDVTLAVDGKFVQAHKLVLSVCSPYFKNLFKANPCKHPIVILKDVGHSDLSYMLDFMYRGEVGVKHEDLPSFLKLAETLKVRGLAGEKIELNNDSHSVKNLDSNLARIRKKISKNTDAEEKYSEFQSSGDKSAKKLIKSRKRRLSSKAESVKKLKSEKCEISDISNCDNNDCDNLSEDEDNKPLLRLVGDNSVNLENSSKLGETQCDNDNYSQCDNKTNFSHWSDEILDSKDSDGPDVLSVFRSDYSEEAEETPQGHLNSLIISRAHRAFVWDYFLKETHQAICLNCGKTFKGQRPNTICEQHLKKRHPEFYKILLEKKIKKAELHMNPLVMKLGGIRSYDEILSAPKRSKNSRTSLIWTYFIKYPAFATCRLCGRNFKGFRPHTSIETHLKACHHRHYLDFMRNREEQRKQLIRDQLGNFFSRIYGVSNHNF